MVGMLLFAACSPWPRSTIPGKADIVYPHLHRMGDAGDGLAAVEEARSTALETGVRDYRFVRRCLERNSQLPLSLRQIDPLIRELLQHRDLIVEPTQDVETCQD